ncbi:unnamed protein product [Penicillium salamii]|nr:unnamed protein product [Penicillium salamii]CAG8061401.1 unnamed protein product [Penicillium salamii]CAG8081644.1 unnamed protein product [Penicillium salamii]CAG8185835.1 unnamed protein product [Penicillium salamii]CAG8383396.1 unnamed protein product [Penicillium salamii]
MLLKLGSVLLPRAPMEVELKLNQEDSTYTPRDTISGEVILHNDSAADLSTVVLKLSGTAISRLSHTSRTETHQIFKKSQRVFPPDVLIKEKGSSVTIGSGECTFPFSITLPKVTECYKADHWSDKSNVSCANIGRWRTQKEHIMRKSPPSTGDSDSIAEVKYSLTVVVTGKSVVKKTRDVQFKYLSDPLPQQRPLKQECVLNVNPNIVAGSALSFWINAELLNGPCLVLDQSIPLKIDIAKQGDAHCSIILSEFQTMLVEKTQVKAQGIGESSTSTWIVQSTANMNYPVSLANCPSGTVTTLRDAIYCHHPLPQGLTSSFEVCNIKRTYRLFVRLGFLIGDHKTQRIIHEFDFPVYVMGSASLIQI